MTCVSDAVARLPPRGARLNQMSVGSVVVLSGARVRKSDRTAATRADNGQNQFFNDKESVTADPTQPGTAYAVWDQLVGPVDNPAVVVHNFFSFTGPSYFAKTTDGGVTWGPSKIIVPMRQNQQSIANVIVVAPSGALYDFFTLITGTGPNKGPQSTAPHGFALAFIKSTDGGDTWTSPQIVDKVDSVTVTDPNTGQPLRTADFDAAPAVDPATGQLYLVWQDARDTTGPNGKGSYSRILFTTSTDGGDTWSDPVVVSNSPAGISAFLPAIAVASDGRVGLTYYGSACCEPHVAPPLDDAAAGASELAIVVPLTRTNRPSPLYVPLDPPEGGVRERSYAMPEMVRSISREPLSKRWGTITAAKLNEITHRVHLLTRST